MGGEADITGLGDRSVAHSGQAVEATVEGEEVDGEDGMGSWTSFDGLVSHRRLADLASTLTCAFDQL